MWGTDEKPTNPAALHAFGDELTLELALLQEGMSGKLKGHCQRLSAAKNMQTLEGLQIKNPALLLYQLRQGSSCLQELAGLQECVKGEVEGYRQQLIAVRDKQALHRTIAGPHGCTSMI